MYLWKGDFIFLALFIVRGSFDPCVDHHYIYDNGGRSPMCPYLPNQCDRYITENWYKVVNYYGALEMPTTKIEVNSCGATYPLWLNDCYGCRALSDHQTNDLVASGNISAAASYTKQNILFGQLFRTFDTREVVLSTDRLCLDKDVRVINGDTVSPLERGTYPTEAEGIVSMTACLSFITEYCYYSYDIQVKNCSHFYVYYLRKTPGCSHRYCFGTNGPCPTTTTTTTPTTTTSSIGETTTAVRSDTTLTTTETETPMYKYFKTTLALGIVAAFVIGGVIAIALNYLLCTRRKPFERPGSALPRSKVDVEPPVPPPYESVAGSQKTPNRFVIWDSHQYGYETTVRGGFSSVDITALIATDAHAGMDEQPSRDCLPSKVPLTSSHYHGICIEPLENGTVGDLVLTSSRNDPNRVVYRIPEYNQQLTSRDLHQKSDDVSRCLLSLGLVKGDVVMCVGVATSDLFPIMHGTYAIGGVYIGPFIYQPEDKCLTEYVRAVKPRILICGYNTTSMRTVLRSVQTRNDNEEVSPVAIITYDMDLNEDNFIPHSGRKVFMYTDFLKRSTAICDEKLLSLKSAVSQEDVALIVSSTGTTGAPKLVCVSHHTLVNFAKFAHIRMNPLLKPEVEAWLGPYGDDMNPTVQSLSALYFSHVTGVMLPSGVNYSDRGLQKIMEVIEKERISSLMTYPFWILKLGKMSSNETRDLTSLQKGLKYPKMRKTVILQIGLLMAHSINSDARLKVLNQCREYVMGYGSTEYILGAATSYTYSSTEEYLNTVGYAFPHTQAKIINENGNTLPVETVGEICLKGWPMFQGYYGNNENNQNPVDVNGWLLTGDVGKMSPNGHINILGRKTDCIRFKKKGDVVYPGLIESVAKKHEKIKDAIVVGLQDDQLGDVMYLCVITEDESSLSEEEVLAFLKPKLLDRDQPHYIHFFKSFPRVGARQKISRELVKDDVMKTVVSEGTKQCPIGN